MDEFENASRDCGVHRPQRPSGPRQQFERLYLLLVDANPFNPAVEAYHVSDPSAPVSLDDMMREAIELSQSGTSTSTKRTIRAISARFSPGHTARAGSSTSAAMQSMTAATRARSTTVSAVSGLSADGRRLTTGGQLQTP